MQNTFIPCVAIPALRQWTVYIYPHAHVDIGYTALQETVEKLLLGKCINDYLKNDRIKDIAKRATWIGNDETHYVRKWIGKNITDLKLLIDLTVHWIETEDLTDKMISSMPE